ncbi:MAG: hypothetical protein K8T91_25650 [Planctomycetes bacterium]|nr:hypothetical protein [Planctomycetota bacterium]
MGNWNDLPEVVIELPACAWCKTTKQPIIVRSESTKRGQVQKVICDQCNQRYLRRIPTAE